MKTALITGASRGIGEQIARAFSANGYNVVINYNKSRERALSIANEIGADAFKADVGDFKQVNELVDFTLQKYKRIDVLVNNAGIALKQMLMQDVTEEEFDELVRVNLKGTFNCCICVIPSMVSNKKGNIINISSIWGQTGGSCEVVYSMTKAGIIGFTRSLACELAPSGIRVNAIAPGFINTEMNGHLSESDRAEFISQIPLMRAGCAEDVANAALFLAGDRADYITGQVISVNGGLY